MTPLLFTVALAAALIDTSAELREPLSLQTALARAHSQNPDLRALRERASAIAARAQAVRKQKLPRFGAEVAAGRTDNAAAIFAHKLNAGQFKASDFDFTRLNSPDAVSHVASTLFVEFPIDVFGRVGLASDVQVAGERAVAQTVREAESTLALQVIEAYLGAVLSCRAAVAAEKAVTAARSREAITQARFTEGVALQSDVLRVRARRRTREADLASQRADLEVAEATLGRLIGAPDGTRFYLTDSAKPVDNAKPLEFWKARAATTRPTLLAAQAQRKAAALAVRLEETSSRPELAAQARVMDNRVSGGGTRSWAVGAMLRWPVYDPTHGKRVAAAMADERAAAQDEQAERDRVRFEVEAAFSRLTAARERLAAAAGGAEEGREALRVVQERRAQGLATLTDELETEAEAFAAELDEINAARTAAQAEAALKRAAGVNSARTIQ